MSMLSSPVFPHFFPAALFYQKTIGPIFLIWVFYSLLFFTKHSDLHFVLGELALICNVFVTHSFRNTITFLSLQKVRLRMLLMMTHGTWHSLNIGFHFAVFLG